uniref:Uncharacterized protein n=1 Tax=Arundo donax TaxID=35708 RepID=A0A0A8XTV0_ARUDO
MFGPTITDKVPINLGLERINLLPDQNTPRMILGLFTSNPRMSNGHL